QLRHGTEVVFRAVDGQPFHRFVELTFHPSGDHLRLADGELVTLAAHLFNQYGKRQLSATLNLPGVGSLGRQHPERTVADQLTVQPVLDQPGGYLGALLPTGERTGVRPDRHRDRRLVDSDQAKRGRPLQIGEGLPDVDFVDAGHGGDVAWPGLLGWYAVQ